ncbi:MAG: C40 family peptidase [Tannerella sp.]|nr:C40 family peptidase [Tannerella sp.]
MKKVINIFFICIAVLSIVSCTARKQSRPHTKYDNRTLSRLSKKIGLRLTQADNIALYDACRGWLGVKYRSGGNSKKGVDCSGLVSILYRQVYGIGLERNSAGMLRKNCAPINRKNLREGDLVFFKTPGSGSPKTPTHVGVYLKNGKFIHSSASNGVIISSLSEPYYVRTWITGGRVKR